MSATLIAVVGVIYAAIAIDQIAKGSLPMAIVFGAYALGNVGLWMSAK